MNYRKNAETDLTRRETEIMELVVQGFSYKDIAVKLFIELNTVSNHLKKIRKKLNVKNMAALIVIYLELKK